MGSVARRERCTFASVCDSIIIIIIMTQLVLSVCLCASNCGIFTQHTYSHSSPATAHSIGCGFAARRDAMRRVGMDARRRRRNGRANCTRPFASGRHNKNMICFNVCRIRAINERISEIYRSLKTEPFVCVVVPVRTMSEHYSVCDGFFGVCENVHGDCAIGPAATRCAS